MFRIKDNKDHAGFVYCKNKVLRISVLIMAKIMKFSEPHVMKCVTQAHTIDYSSIVVYDPYI